MISFIVSMHSLRMAGSVERIKPLKPAQMALTLILRPFKACLISFTRLANPPPPGSKPTTPNFSIKSSFSFKLSPGAIPSWKESFNSRSLPGLSLPFSPSAVFAGLEEQEAKAVLPTAKAAPDKEVLKKFLLFNVINSLDYFLSIGLPGTGTTKPLISIFPKFKSFGV